MVGFCTNVEAGSRGSWDGHPLKGDARDCLAGDVEAEEAGISKTYN